MLYTVCLWSVCACVSEIPSWFKSIVFGKAMCCTPWRTGSAAVDVFMLFLLFSQIIELTRLQLMNSLFFRFIFPQLYFDRKQARFEG